MVRRNDLPDNVFLLLRHTGMRIGECADPAYDCLSTPSPLTARCRHATKASRTLIKQLPPYLSDAAAAVGLSAAIVPPRT